MLRNVYFSDKMARSELLILFIFATGLCFVYTCNNAICGPRVSKCMLIKCCGCDMTDLKNCTCCRDCQICLESLYTECCSCVGEFKNFFYYITIIFFFITPTAV